MVRRSLVAGTAGYGWRRTAMNEFHICFVGFKVTDIFQKLASFDEEKNIFLSAVFMQAGRRCSRYPYSRGPTEMDGWPTNATF